jgi:hypothetical protein
VKVTLERYYKSFTSLRALFAAIPFAPVIAHAVAPSSKIAGYLYPPLGNFENLAQVFTLGVLLLTTFVVYVSAQSMRRIYPIVPGLLIIGFAFGVVALIPLYVSYVRFIPVPSANAEVPVSVGYQQTDFALQTYPRMSDWEILHDSGPWEQQIQKIWTLHSISVVRIQLWSWYTFSLACFLSVVSFAVYRHASEPSSP